MSILSMFDTLTELRHRFSADLAELGREAHLAELGRPHARDEDDTAHTLAPINGKGTP